MTNHDGRCCMKTCPQESPEIETFSQLNFVSADLLNKHWDEQNGTCMQY
jgi:hypothetical protein